MSAPTTKPAAHQRNGPQNADESVAYTDRARAALRVLWPRLTRAERIACRRAARLMMAHERAPGPGRGRAYSPTSSVRGSAWPIDAVAFDDRHAIRLYCVALDLAVLRRRGSPG